MTDGMTADQMIARVRALDKTATPGPWEDRTHDLTDDVEVVHDGEHLSWVAMTGDASEQRSAEDAEFIAAARSMLPAAVEALAVVRNLHPRPRTVSVWSGESVGYIEAEGNCASCGQAWPCDTYKATEVEA